MVYAVIAAVLLDSYDMFAKLSCQYFGDAYAYSGNFESGCYGSDSRPSHYPTQALHLKAHVQLGKTTLVGKENVIPGRGTQDFFGGIPFAEPPVGFLRFAPPVPRFSLGVPTFHATNYSLLCPQSQFPFGGPPSVMDEDRLTINVLRPSGVQESSSLPVMAWIGGLGYSGCFANDVITTRDITFRKVYNPDRYNPYHWSFKAQTEEPLSYLSVSIIGLVHLDFRWARSYHKGALNLGMKDTLVALEWVQRNIAAFGGDPKKVGRTG
ncbi:Lipase 1, partial [Grifola frondosa]